MTIDNLMRFGAMISYFTHIAAAAAHAVATGEDPHGTAAKIDAHLTAFDQVVNEGSAVIAAVADATATAAGTKPAG